MYPHATIYQFGKSHGYGELALHASRARRFFYRFLRSLGGGLIGFGVIAVIFVFWPPIKEEILFRTGKSEVKLEYNGFGKLLEFVEADRISRVQEEARELGVDSNFSIVVPKIGAKSKAIANVDPGREEEYKDALMKGVAHAKGTAFPGEGRNIFLFAHSTSSPSFISRYNAVFYLLKEVEKGDEVVVFFADKKYEYRVTEKNITEPNDISWLKDTGEERLVLQTCWPPGTISKRLLVVAKPKI